MKKAHRLAASIGIVAVLVTPGISAFASEDSTTYVMNALQSVSRAEKNSYSDVLSNRSLGMGVKRQDVAVRFDDGAVQVEVPWDARDGVSLQSSLGSISVVLPFASQAKRASLTQSWLILGLELV
jgi:hypothetical protein